MKVNNEIILKKRNNNILPKIKSELVHKIKKVNKNLEGIELYKKFSTRLDSKGKHKKKKKKKLRFVSAVNEVKILNLEEKDKDIDKNKLKIKKFNNNDFIEKKINLKELSQKKRIFSEKVKLIKIYKRNKSPKPREESSFDIIRKYSLKILETNRSVINTKREKEKEIFEKLEKGEKSNLNDIKFLNSRKPRNLPPLLKVNYSSMNLCFFEENNNYQAKNSKNDITKFNKLQPINKRYLMRQYSEIIDQQNQEKEKNCLLLNNISNINISTNRSIHLNQNNIKGKIIKPEKDSNNEKRIYKLKSEFNFKEYNYLNYAIVPGNASYLVKNCMCHRINWKESFSCVTNIFNFKWQQNTNGISYSKLGKIGNIRQVVNHFENHFAISNKANMFINMMLYCEQRKISVFKFVPLTIIFELDLLNNLDINKYNQKKINQLKKFIDENESKYIKKYNDIGKYFQEEEFIKEKKRRIEYLKERRKSINGFNEYFHSNEEEKNKAKNEKKFKSIYPTYIDFFGKPELIEKVSFIIESNLDHYHRYKEWEKEMNNNLGIGTNIEIPETHYAGKNMWIIKATNLCQGKCIQIAHNFNQMLKILNKFKEGVDFHFTEKVIEEKEENQNEKINSNEKNDKSSLYCCNKIIIQKYIERPLLYKGRKCDMRVWVLVTHNLKVYFFKEGHLKTCSIPYNLISKDAYSHITNYSFQKHNANFQKYEKGNEVPFHDFQKFLDENYPEKHYIIKRDLYNQINKIVSISMMSVREQINQNDRNYQFEIFGYDFMLDEEFNLFLIEINDDPGIEESSPWIQIIIPRMLDDALRLTIDQIFTPKYDFSRNYKKYRKNEKENKMRIISDYFKEKIKYNHKYTKTEENMIKNNKIRNKKNSIEVERKRYLTETNNNKFGNLKSSKEIENNNKRKYDKNNYITPFPVPGYKNNENLWQYVCDLNGEDPLDKFLDKKQSGEGKYLSGVKYLFNKKKN